MCGWVCVGVYVCVYVCACIICTYVYRWYIGIAGYLPEISNVLLMTRWLMIKTKVGVQWPWVFTIHNVMLLVIW